MSDAQSCILDLAVIFAAKEADGQALSWSERTVADIAWIDTQVAANGLEGWLYETTNERITGTLRALSEARCQRISDILLKALAVAGVDPQHMTDEHRERLLDELPDSARDRLGHLDREVFVAMDECMDLCLAFAAAHHLTHADGDGVDIAQRSDAISVGIAQKQVVKGSDDKHG